MSMSPSPYAAVKREINVEEPTLTRRRSGGTTHLSGNRRHDSFKETYRMSFVPSCLCTLKPLYHHSDKLPNYHIQKPLLPFRETSKLSYEEPFEFPNYHMKSHLNEAVGRDHILFLWNLVTFLHSEGIFNASRLAVRVQARGATIL
ncbi:unnamed protein product [Miscanthus lutarioriparius]|uniref:Uncharacterized protein n=1 Tax=Miscanthus lutarioriparius TaxID=422564 RepID=A0A811N368_9POAL|nr:unnamed protein product [Miscanthus lutarioriparius]